MFNSGPFESVTHVIFDLDGVLLDTEPLYTLATQNILGRYGKTFDWSIKMKVMGLKGTEMAKTIVKLLDLPITGEEYYKLATAEYSVVMKDTRLMPGALALVQHLYKNNIPMAVATSSSQGSYDLKTGNHKEFFKLFHHVVCGGTDPEVTHGKPHPDIFLVCASKFPDNPRPEKCLVFEDAPNGVQSAINAGMQVIMVPDKNIPLEMQKSAHVKVDSLEQVPLDLFGLPPL